MGTRAVYTFIDEDDRHSVYKHWDGYPRTACRFIANALKLAWPLPRFEADEFAAAFVAANKQEAGDLRLTASPGAHGDLAYTYEIRCQRGRLHVRIHDADSARLLFDGSLEDAQHFAATTNRKKSAMTDTDESNIHELLASRKQIAAIWSIEDVKQIRPDLTDDQAWEVLQDVLHQHDADFGINWLTLETVAEDLFGPAPQADQA